MKFVTLHTNLAKIYISWQEISCNSHRNISDSEVNPFNDLDIIQFAFLRMWNDIFSACVFVFVQTFPPQKLFMIT